MRKFIYILLLVPLFFVPLNRVDIATLLPIEAVALYREGDVFVLETDTEHIGKGETAEQALLDLKENTAAVVYLDTAVYLIVSEDAVEGAEELRDVLKPTAEVCVADVRGRVREAAQYLRVHANLPKLRNWKVPDKVK